VVALNQVALGTKADAKSFGIELRAIPVPDTDAGRHVKAWLDHSADRSLELMTEEARHVHRPPLNITLLRDIRELQRLELTLVQVVFEMTGLPGIPVSELTKEFEKADSCVELSALGTD